jgi:site-specific DNA-methyltransferase (adenine-specific)
MGKDWDSFGLEGKKPRINAGTYEKMSQHGRPSGWGANGNPSCRNCGGDMYRNGDRKCRCDAPDFPNHGRGQNAAFGEWCRQWCEAALRVIKPGGYMLAMGGSRTYHRLACAVEDAGWEIRDCLLWLYGTGFPKGQGCLKPAYEPILLARKPGPRVLPLGIDECRVPTAEPLSFGGSTPGGNFRDDAYQWGNERSTEQHPAGRYPANVLHDGSEEVLEAFAASGERGGGFGIVGSDQGGVIAAQGKNKYHRKDRKDAGETVGYGDTGTAARFFYCAKASKGERGEGNGHPTVKPLALMRWLVRLACPAGGIVLDPFAGSGTTGLAALQEGRRAVLIEREPAYCEIIRRRLAQHEPLFAAPEESRR